MVAGGHAWLLGRHAWLLGGGYVWLLEGGVPGCWGGMCGCQGGMRGCWEACIGYDEIRSMSGRYASYWNAFLCGLSGGIQNRIYYEVHVLYGAFSCIVYRNRFVLKVKKSINYQKPSLIGMKQSVVAACICSWHGNLPNMSFRKGLSSNALA